MTVHVALFLSSDGIALAHRQRDGHWALLDDTDFAAPDLDAAMARLRAQAEAREGKDFATLLILPDDQILYTSLTAPTTDPEITADRIEEGLEGLTPYAVSELVYDWRAVEADRVKLAVVAGETLDEARAFAEAHGFSGAGFAAMPPQEKFPGMPLFALTDAAEGLAFSEDGIALGPDTWSAEEDGADATGDGAVAEETGPENTAPEDADAGAASSGDEISEDAQEATTGPGDAVDDTPSAPVAEGEEKPAATGTAPGADATPAGLAKGTRDATPDTGKTAKGGETGTAKDRDADPSAEGEAATATEDASEVAGDAAPTAESAVAQDEESIHGGASAAEAEDAPGAEALASELDPEEAIAATAARGGRDEPAPPDPAPGAEPAPGPEGKEEVDDGAPLRLEDPSLTGPVRPLADDESTAGEDAPPDDGLPSAPSSAVLAARKASAAFAAPAPAFSARRNRVPARDEGENGTDAVGDASPTDGPAAGDGAKPEAPAARNPLARRLSRARPAEPPETGESAGESAERASRPAPRRADGRTARPVVPPAGAGRSETPADAAPRKGRLSGLTAPPSPGAIPQDSARTGGFGRLTGLLSRTRGDPEAARAGQPDMTAGGGRDVRSGAGRLTALGMALREDEAAERQATQPDDTATATATAPDAAPATDETLTGGLLGRKTGETSRPGLSTGLLLTVILLILLAAIAVWSALFLPDSPVARLFGPGEEVAEGDPLDAPPPPEAITAPPAIGEIADVGAPPGRLLDEDDAAQAPPVTAEDEAAVDGMERAAQPEPAEPAPESIAEDAPAPAPAPAQVTPGSEEVPALQPLPEGALPSREETLAVFEEYGIWQRPPERPDIAAFETVPGTARPGTDPDLAGLDGAALAPPRLDPDATPRRVPPPPSFGAVSGPDPEDLVEPTPDGVTTPAGAFVVAGRPPVAAVPRPREAAPLPPTPSFGIEDAILGTVQPTPRPDDLGAVVPAPLPEAADDGAPVARASLAPVPRVAEPARDAAAASLFVAPGGTTADPEADPVIENASAQAVAASLLPPERPADIAALLANATPRTPDPPPTAVEPAAVAPAPSIPSNADVARAATQTNELRLRDINLIGVTGTPSERRALVRLPSGRFVRVGVGDRLDGGRVAAIGETTLQYVRNGRTLTLDIPG